eukprot:gb/GECH01013282.1/.p1 GENE.gb/GECH01013282.1/~~gb/GECH01013282.1/.p1  ORF type:complete len:147 (+),score=29.41 gb/GECH01013282.1/:1-441(+)
MNLFTYLKIFKNLLFQYIVHITLLALIIVFLWKKLLSPQIRSLFNQICNFIRRKTDGLEPNRDETSTKKLDYEMKKAREKLLSEYERKVTINKPKTESKQNKKTISKRKITRPKPNPLLGASGHFPLDGNSSCSRPFRPQRRMRRG